TIYPRWAEYQRALAKEAGVCGLVYGISGASGPRTSITTCSWWPALNQIGSLMRDELLLGSASGAIQKSFSSALISRPILAHLGLVTVICGSRRPAIRLTYFDKLPKPSHFLIKGERHLPAPNCSSTPGAKSANVPRDLSPGKKPVLSKV